MRSALLFLSSLVFSCLAVAQPALYPNGEEAHASVQAVLDRLLDGMQRGDSTLVRTTLHPEARFFAVVTRDNHTQMLPQPIDAFLQAVGAPHDAPWVEHVANLDIRVDGGLAAAWMDYWFYVGNRLSHCGINAFHLVHGEAGWRIVNLIDTQRRAETCPPEPE